jgi:hypothetical protein
VFQSGFQHSIFEEKSNLELPYCNSSAYCYFTHETMPRRSPTLDTIEYIGPRPRKPQSKRPNFLGGFVVLLIAAGAFYFFGKPFLPLLQAQNTAPSSERADVLIAELQPSARPGDRLAAAALQRLRFKVAYEDAYYAIDFPNGDIPLNKGRAEDLVVRSYRALGVDLQQRVHEDIKEHFSEYPLRSRASRH